MAGSVTAQLQLCTQLESQLRSQAKELNFWDRSVREVRKQLRTALEGILLQNYKVAQEKQLEFTLWHIVFYRPIGDFRRRHAEVERRGEKGREAMPKLRNSFQSLLTDATAFYRALIVKLQATYGDVGCRLPDDTPPNQETPPPGLQPAAVQQDVRESVHRCLICLGDLARYEANLSPEKKKDWSKADDLYIRAIAVYPEGGNAYNQRAVLAGLEGRDLAAVYSYFRSLAVAAPFHIARENLMQLFEQVRARYEKLPRPALGRSAAHRGPPGKLAELQRVVETRMLRLHGLLFTKIDLDAFPTILPAALSDLSDFLGREAVVRGPLGHGPQRSDVAVFEMAVLALFAVHNIPAEEALGTAEVGKRKQLRHFALELLFSFTAHLAKALAGAGVDPGKGGMPASPVLPAMSVLLQWLATHPEELRDPETDANSPRSQLCKALAELTVVGAASCETTGISLASLAETLAGQAAQALPEDRDLRSFQPLQAAHSQLDFDSTPAPQEERHLRLMRMLMCLRTVATSMLAADLPQAAGSPAAGKAVANFISKVSKAFGGAAPAKATIEADVDEDEEMIMFNPVPAASAPLPAAPLAADTPRATEPMPMVTSPAPLPAPAVDNSSGAQTTLASVPMDTFAVPQQAPSRGWDPMISNWSALQPSAQQARPAMAGQGNSLTGILSSAQPGIGGPPAVHGASRVQTSLYGAPGEQAGSTEPTQGVTHASVVSLPGSSVDPFSRTVSPGILSDAQRDSAAPSRAMSTAQQLSQEQFSRPPTRPSTPGAMHNSIMKAEAKPAPPGFPSATHLGSRSANNTPTPATGLLPPPAAFDLGQPGMNAQAAPSASDPTSSLLQAQLAGLPKGDPSLPPGNGTAGQGLWAASAVGPSGEGIWGNPPPSAGYPGSVPGLGQLPGAKLEASDGFGASMQSYLQGRRSETYSGGLPLSPMPSGLPTELFGRDLMEHLGPPSGGSTVMPSSNSGLGAPTSGQAGHGQQRQVVRDPWGLQPGTGLGLGGLGNGQQDPWQNQQQQLLSAGLGQSHLGQVGLGGGLAQNFGLAPQQHQQHQQPQAGAGFGLGGLTNGQQSWQMQQLQQQQQFGLYAAQQSAALNQLTAEQLQGLGGLQARVAAASPYHQFQSPGGLGGLSGLQAGNSGLQPGNSSFMQGGQTLGVGPKFPLGQSSSAQHLGSHFGNGGNFGLPGGQNLGGAPLGSQALGGYNLGAQQLMGGNTSGRQSPWGAPSFGQVQNSAARSQQPLGVDPRAGSPAQYLSALGQGAGGLAGLGVAGGEAKKSRLGQDDSWLDAFEQQQRQLAANKPAGTPQGGLQQAFGAAGPQGPGAFFAEGSFGK